MNASSLARSSAASSMVSSMCNPTTRITNCASPGAEPPRAAYSVTATTLAIPASWARSPTSTPRPFRASASARIAASCCSTSRSSARPLPRSRTSVMSAAVSVSLNGGSDRAWAARSSGVSTSLALTVSPCRGLDVGLAAEARGKLFTGASRLPARRPLRAHLHCACERASDPVARRHDHRAAPHHRRDGDLEGEVESLLESQHHALWRGELGADEDAAEVAPDKACLHLVARPNSAWWASDMTQAANRREPVSVLDVGDHREPLLGWNRESYVGACLHTWMALVA